MNPVLLPSKLSHHVAVTFRHFLLEEATGFAGPLAAFTCYTLQCTLYACGNCRCQHKGGEVHNQVTLSMTFKWQLYSVHFTHVGIAGVSTKVGRVHNQVTLSMTFKWQLYSVHFTPVGIARVSTKVGRFITRSHYL